VAEPVVCGRCGAGYRPALTGGECPLCGLAAGGAPGRATRWARLSGDGRLVAMVVAATVANVVVFVALAMALGGRA
jgi:hypothetical protein